MGVLKHCYSEEVRTYLRNTGRAVTHYEVSDLFGKTYLKAQTGANAVNGFWATGIYPVDRAVFAVTNFAPSEDFEPQTATEDEPRAIAPVEDEGEAVDKQVQMASSRVCASSQPGRAKMYRNVTRNAVYIKGSYISSIANGYSCSSHTNVEGFETWKT